jgi:predicted hotdog family 3-hydroxylacyl-ACP dehydratase
MSAAILDRHAIAQRIPHAGAMCLLDRMLAVDPARIVCAAGSHRSPANPLRASGQLSSVHAIEYAAQAMALHRSFADDATGAAPRGMLTSVRDVACQVDRLDDIDADLTIAATRIAGDGTTVLYHFSVSAGERELVSGRASAVLDVAAGAGAPR